MTDIKPPSSPPSSLQELQQRCARIAGLTLGELAHGASVQIPADFKRHKGWSGQLLELWLGAEAGSKPTQDFPNLGVELKSLPIDSQGVPLETTYVCFAPLMDVGHIRWETSNVRNKLSQVLWVPVQGERDIPPRDRQVGSGFLWRPNAAQEASLKQDWEELMDMICLGQVEQITAKHGQVLQIRPKAADGSALTQAIGSSGNVIQTRPRGFYLRKSFTQQLLNDAFGF